MRIFKSKWFSKFARKARISNAKLREAIKRAEEGLVDADYGGGVIKQRISRPGEGKSGGYRSVVLYHRGRLSFFVYGFAKNEQDNMGRSEEQDFKELAKILLALSDDELDMLARSGKYTEVKDDEET